MKFLEEQQKRYVVDIFHKLYARQHKFAYRYSLVYHCECRDFAELRKGQAKRSMDDTKKIVIDRSENTDKEDRNRYSLVKFFW